jgi:hypothetical protein
MNEIEYYEELIFKAKIVRMEDDHSWWIYIATDTIEKALAIGQLYCTRAESEHYSFCCEAIKLLNGMVHIDCNKESK